ncbi:hypothetical protein AB0N62_38550 [Streptomyces sp. NPDC093982]|uniref:hypothetical protein n=1 Tax=Streptomyces sp. NPDC093982 TaxID=3155077 RepID=UPI00342B7449
MAAPVRIHGRRQGAQTFAEVGDVLGWPGSEQSMQAPQPGAGGGAHPARGDLLEDVQSALRSIGRLIRGLGLGEHESGGRPPGGAGRTRGRGNLGTHGPDR